MMDVLIRFACLVALALGGGHSAFAQYNLRTDPAGPSAGSAFDVLFDDNPCLRFVLPGDGGSAPLVELVGGTLQVTVDVVEYFDCNTPQPVTTYAVPVQGLPAGSYELELIGRALLSPEFTNSFQAVPLLVAPPSAPFAIPTLHWPVMVILVTLLGISGAAVGWRKALARCAARQF